MYTDLISKLWTVGLVGFEVWGTLCEDRSFVEFRFDVVGVTAHEVPAKEEFDREGLADDKQDQKVDLLSCDHREHSACSSASLAPISHGPS